MDNPRSLSAQFKEDFAYPTVKDRLPIILTKVVDTIHRMKNCTTEKYGEDVSEELKSIVGRLSKLRHELQTDKPLLSIEDNVPDVIIWNDYLQRDRVGLNGKEPSWFVSSWLYTECYFYRRIREAICLSDKLKDLDPFQDQKQNALISAFPACVQLATYLKECTVNSSIRYQLGELLSEFIQISLWGNKCDLSISAGEANTQNVNAVTSLKHLEPNLLCNDIDKIWKLLCPTNKPENSVVNKRVDIVLDNAGFELFTDLCLADFLLESKLATSVRFHGKSMPWFVSDITRGDLDWTLDELERAESSMLNHYGTKWKGHFKSGAWEYKAAEFWTLPFDFCAMHAESPDLYDELSGSTLLIFKGDLNYRKLTGDLKWEFDTPFDRALRGFSPAPLCALRTLKCDLAIGITLDEAASAKRREEDWMLTGRWGVIQYHE